MESNCLRISGRLSDAAPLRYTPAGIPVREFRLKHASVQEEAGIGRKAEFEISCLAVADAALGISDREAGKQVRLEGFLARKSIHSAELVLHAKQIEFIG